MWWVQCINCEEVSYNLFENDRWASRMIVTDFEFEVLYGERRPSRHEAILIVEGSEDIPSKSRVAIGKDVLKAEC